MRVLQVMGCTSDQYASMERYLVEKAKYLYRIGSTLTVVYEKEPASKEFVKDLEAVGGRLFIRKFKIQKIFLDFYWLWKILKKEKINVVHTYFNPTNYYVGLFLYLIGFKNVVKTAANLPFTIDRKDVSLFHKIKHRILSGLFFKTICRSEGVKEKYIELGVKPERLAVADGGCDTKYYKFDKVFRIDFRKNFRVDDNCLLIGTSSRLVKAKNIDGMLDSFAFALRQTPYLHLFVAGDGPEKSNLLLKARDLNIENHITFLGHVENAVWFYSGIDIFSLASITEGMSNSVLEAMSCEKPVILSDIPPNRSIIGNVENGYLIDFRNPGAFSGIIKKLIDDSQLLLEMGKRNRNIVKKNFSLIRRIEIEHNIYKEMIQCAE